MKNHYGNVINNKNDRQNTHIYICGKISSVRFLTFTIRASCYSTRLSWAHTSVSNWAVCLGHKVVTLLEVSEEEEGVVAYHLLIGPLKKPALGCSRYRDANPVPTSPLNDDITTAPSGKHFEGDNNSRWRREKWLCGQEDITLYLSDIKNLRERYNNCITVTILIG